MRQSVLFGGYSSFGAELDQAGEIGEETAVPGGEVGSEGDD